MSSNFNDTNKKTDDYDNNFSHRLRKKKKVEKRKRKKSITAQTTIERTYLTYKSMIIARG